MTARTARQGSKHRVEFLQVVNGRWCSHFSVFSGSCNYLEKVLNNVKCNIAFDRSAICDYLVTSMERAATDLIFKALADPTRRDLLGLLRDGPRTTGALSAEFDQTRKDLLVKAHDDANAQHQKLLEQARAEFETLREQQKDTLDRERLDISREIVKLTCKEVFTVARKTLTDLSSTSLEASMADVLITKIREMNSDDKIHLTDSLKQNSESVVVNSTFELPPAQRGAIKAAVKDAFAFDKEIEFETNPDLVCGIELSTQGYKVSWSISDYLKSLEQSVDAPPEAQNAA